MSGSRGGGGRWLPIAIVIFLLAAVGGTATALVAGGRVNLAGFLGDTAAAGGSSPSAGSGSPGASAGPIGPSALTEASPTAQALGSAGPSASAAPSPSASPAASGAPRITGTVDPALSRRLQKALETARKNLVLPGVEATIIFSDGSSWTGVSGLANVPKKVPVTADTPFAIASVTKTFTSALILRLAEQGKLGLDDKLSKWVPTYPDANKLTVRMLLNHTSGLQDFYKDGKFDAALNKDKSKFWTPQAVLAFDPTYFNTVVFQPGKGYRYSNTNYLLLGLVAEKAGGAPWATLVHQELIDPLGLSSVIVQGVDTPAVPLAHSNVMYAGAKGQLLPRDVTDGTAIAPFTSVVTAGYSAAALASTSLDLARWAQDLYGGNVLTAASRKQLLTWVPAALYSSSWYGLGVSRKTFVGHIAYGHTGALIGTRSTTRWFPKDRVAMAALFNRDGLHPNGKDYLGDDVLQYLAAVLWPTAPKPGASPMPAP